MLNRRMPSTTIKSDKPVRGRGYGKSPSKNFDLDYALKIAIEMEYNRSPNVLKAEWTALRETIELIKKEKVCTK